MEKGTLIVQNGCYERGLLVFISFAVFAVMANAHVHLQKKEQVQEGVQGSFIHPSIT